MRKRSCRGHSHWPTIGWSVSRSTKRTAGSKIFKLKHPSQHYKTGCPGPNQAQEGLSQHFRTKNVLGEKSRLINHIWCFHRYPANAASDESPVPPPTKDCMDFLAPVAHVNVFALRRCVEELMLHQDDWTPSER